MKKILLVSVISSFFLTSCNSVRDSAGVNRKVVDEYAVIENPPLVIPPDFNLLPPDQMESKDIKNVDSDLAKEILFGLDESIDQSDDNETLLDQIVTETKANDVENNIRDLINEEFAGQKSSINDEVIFDSEEELNNAISDTQTNMKKNKTENKEKKKKRFFFF